MNYLQQEALAAEIAPRLFALAAFRSKAWAWFKGYHVEASS